jgi:CubicO group peptidase (beta-lactamase class C family)
VAAGEDCVHDLLRRACLAGLAPGAVAGWGSPPADYDLVAEGWAALFPTKIRAEQSTWFDLASLTKPLATATLCLLGFRTDAFGQATTVGEVLSEVRGTPVAELTVGQLLTHTSGLPGWLPLYAVCEGRRELVPARLGAVSLIAPPGSRVVYSCVGYVMLGLMLQRISDQDLESLFCASVLRPLGLEEALGFRPARARCQPAAGAARPVVERRLCVEAGFDPDFVPPYEPGLPDDGNARFLGGTAGNAGLFGTAAGVLALTAEYRPGGGRLLTDSEVVQATSNHTPGKEQARAFGWQLAASPGCSAGPSLPPDAFGHTGFTGVSAWFDPLRGRGWILLTNRLHPGGREADLHPLRRRFHSTAVGMPT